MENYTELKAARVTLLNAASRKDNNWWKLFARYAEIAKRKIWYIEIGLLACLILSIGGCNTARSTLNLGKSIGQDGAWILGKMSDNIQTQEN